MDASDAFRSDAPLATAQPWHVQLLRFTLAVCGCDRAAHACDEAPSDAQPAFHVTAKAMPLRIYFNVEEALLTHQLRYRRMMAQAQIKANHVAAACSALAIPEDRQRIASAQRILPAWYKTRPQQHWHAKTVTGARAGTVQRPVISAVVVYRPSRRAGRTGALVAREPCRAQFTVIHKAEQGQLRAGPGGDLQASTPLRSR